MILISTAWIVFIFTPIKALFFQQDIRFIKLPICAYVSIAESLSDVFLEPFIEGHNASLVGSHIRNIHAAGMFPSSLPWHYQKGVVSSKNARKQNEEEQNNHEEHPNSLDMVKVLFVVFESLPWGGVAIAGDTKCKHLSPALKEEEEPKLSMI